MNLRSLLLVCCGSVAAIRFSDPVTWNGDLAEDDGHLLEVVGDAAPVVPWVTAHFDVKLDQFSYSNTDTFQMKYLYNRTYYKAGGPIFFYTGNEGSVEGFATATGIMFDLAPTFNAAIVFAEHRFYGTSLPFGNQSYSSVENMGLLTSDQALADYAQFLTALKTKTEGLPISFPSNTKVIAFGGSYGGMLSAWFRMKYPHIVDGAWAASAPLLYFQGGGVDEGAFDGITTRTYNESGCNNYIIANAWNAISNLSSTPEGCQFLNGLFNLDPTTQINSTTDGVYLRDFIREAIEYMAMVDYPYPTSFLTPMPGSPVKVACQGMNTPGTNFTDQQLVTMIASAATVYYNYTGDAAPYCINPNICGDAATAALGSPLGWPWQECSEIIIDMCARGMPNDFFWNECGTNNIANLASYCNGTFAQYGWTNNTMNVNAVAVQYGLTVAGASNIILTQGHLDPWSGGGYNTNSSGVSQSRGIYVVEIPGSAHHLDLRTPNKCDPNTVTNARYQIVSILSYFLGMLDGPPVWKPLPTLVPNNLDDSLCADVNMGYPWNQTDTQQTQSTTSRWFAAATLLVSAVHLL